MAIPRFITPTVLIENSGLINTVKDKKGRGKVYDTKEQIKQLRRVYREFRDVYNFAHTKIVQKMKGLFPKKYSILIDHAAFIEDKIIYVPRNQIPRWVTVKPEALYSLIHHALTTTGDQRSAIRLITTYLWHLFSKGEDITPPTDVYDTMGQSKHNFRIDLQNSYGVTIIYPRYLVKFGQQVLTWMKITWNNKLPEKGVTYDTAMSVKSRTQLNGPQPFPQAVEDQFALHQLYHPQEPFQTADRDLPIVLSDGERITIPLVPGIVTLLLAYLVPSKALHAWLKAGGVSKPSKRIKTLYTRADKCANTLNNRVFYPTPAKVSIIRAPRLHLGQYMTVQYEMMQRGLPVNQAILEGLLPVKDPLLSSQRNNKRHQVLLKRKFQILWAIKKANGWYRGTYHLESHSERTHYRKHPIQSFPSCYREAVEAEKGYTFVYLDIVAHDLAILFNLANDQTGLGIISAGNDPYLYLGATVFPCRPDDERRELVKEVVSPWIYGAGIGVITSKGRIDSKGVNAVKTAIQTQFPDAWSWIDKLSKAAKSKYKIPAKYNTIDNLDIPIPPSFCRTVAPSLIIQRTGSTIIKNAVIWLDNHSNLPAKVLLTVHDSILIICRRREQAIAQNDLIEAVHQGMQQTAIKHLNAKIGYGKTWAGAERAMGRQIMQT